MSQLSRNNGFDFVVLARYLFYIAVIVGIAWIIGLWRIQPKNYACYSGWSNTWKRTEVVDYGSLQLYVWSVKRDCLLGASDRYDPKGYQKALGLPTSK